MQIKSSYDYDYMHFFYQIWHIFHKLYLTYTHVAILNT